MQRNLANIQKKLKDLTSKIKSEPDQVKKAELKKQYADLDSQRVKLDSELEDAVQKLHADATLEIKSKITGNERKLVKEYIKKILRKK